MILGVDGDQDPSNAPCIQLQGKHNKIGRRCLSLRRSRPVICGAFAQAALAFAEIREISP